MILSGLKTVKITVSMTRLTRLTLFLILYTGEGTLPGAGPKYLLLMPLWLRDDCIDNRISATGVISLSLQSQLERECFC